jgi:SAM-dependent methyltransferase
MSLDELENLRQQIARLEIENREISQKLFDQYEWNRQRQRSLHDEISGLRRISAEYQVLDFFLRQYEKTTGLPRKVLLEDAGAIRISLVIAPLAWSTVFEAWFRSILNQEHDNFEVITVLGRSFPELPMIAEAPGRIRFVRVADSVPLPQRVEVGFNHRSGSICGFLSQAEWLYPGSLRNVALFFAENRSVQVMSPPAVSVCNDLMVLIHTPEGQSLMDLWIAADVRFGGVFFRREAFEIVHGIDSSAEGAWQYATMLRFARCFDVKRADALVVVRVETDSATVHEEAGKEYDAVRASFQKMIWKLEWFRQRLRSVLRRLRSKLFAFPPPLWFPIADTITSKMTGSINLEKTPRCPITEELPDRFLFSLLRSSTGGDRVDDVFFSSRSAVAMLSRRSGSLGREEDKPALTVSKGPSCDDPEWQFLAPIQLALTSRADSVAPAEPVPPDDTTELPSTYEAMVGSLLSKHFDSKSEALWLGDRQLRPEPAGLFRYEEKYDWDAIPGLAGVDFGRLRESGFLKDRNDETGSQFDLIHLAGVLHYCSRPRYLLRFLASALKYGGVLLLSTPNLDSDQLACQGPAWAHWAPDRTQFVYGLQSLRALLEHCGFKEEAVTTFTHSAWSRGGRGDGAGPVRFHAGTLLNANRRAPFLARKGRKPKLPAGVLHDYLIALFVKVY